MNQTTKPGEPGGTYDPVAARVYPAFEWRALVFTGRAICVNLIVHPQLESAIT